MMKKRNYQPIFEFASSCCRVQVVDEQWRSIYRPPKLKNHLNTGLFSVLYSDINVMDETVSQGVPIKLVSRTVRWNLETRKLPLFLILVQKLITPTLYSDPHCK